MSQTTNLPKLPEVLPLALVQQIIDADTAPLRERADELIGSCKRFSETFPTIETPEADAKAAEILAVVQRFIGKSGRVETARVALKAPILAADNAIGSLSKGPFARIAVSVETAASTIARASTNYKVKVEREIREKAQAEAARLAEQSRLAEESAARGGIGTFEQAADAATAAEAYEKIAESKSADLTRTHGDGVGTTSLRYKRVVTIVAPADVPRVYCSPDLSLITRGAGKAGDPIPTIAGVKIEDVPDLTVRR
jgi:hypothetical protein